MQLDETDLSKINKYVKEIITSFAGVQDGAIEITPEFYLS